jgi:membrane peptidoglycan carboxypeptidase
VGSPWELPPGYLDPPASGGRVQSFTRALAISNNQCFARLAVHDLGEAPLLDELARVGLLDAPAPGHAAGRIGLSRGAFHLGQLASGLSGSFVTPLGAARLAASLADGEAVEPTWVAGAWDDAGTPLALPPRPPPHRVWPPELAQTLREAMVDVTEHGTAARAFRSPTGEPRLGPVRVAGKTGTLSGSQPPGRYRWFLGVAPAEAPQVAVAALVVDRPPGASSAAEIAAAALRAMFCDAGGCSATRAEAWHARAQARDAATEQRIAGWTREQERRAALENAWRTAAMHDVVDLDQPPRPLGRHGFEFPTRLRREKVDGELVLLLELGRDGEVLDVRVDSSDLPEFDDFVAREVRSWRFTTPTLDGRPVNARARLPIAIQIN